MVEAAESAAERRNDVRLGQHWFNSLSHHRRDIANEVITKHGIDPYYNDGNLNRFLNFVKDCWDQ